MSRRRTPSSREDSGGSQTCSTRRGCSEPARDQNSREMAERCRAAPPRVPRVHAAVGGHTFPIGALHVGRGVDRSQSFRHRSFFRLAAREDERRNEPDHDRRCADCSSMDGSLCHVPASAGGAPRASRSTKPGPLRDRADRPCAARPSCGAPRAAAAARADRRRLAGRAPSGARRPRAPASRRTTCCVACPDDALGARRGQLSGQGDEIRFTPSRRRR